MRKYRSAFTLVELLVVVGIILVLVSLVLSSFNRARALSSRVRCENNVRTLLMATQQYVMNDEQGRLPYANWGPGGTYDPGPAQPGWLYDYPKVGTTPHDMRTGALWKYIQNEDVYHCPLHTPPYAAGPSENITSYLINGAVCGYGSKAPSWSLSSFKDPTHQMLFFECATTGILVQVSGANFWNDGSSYPYETYLSPRHGTGASVGFFDFHVEYYDRNDYFYQLNISPGALWCNPGSSNGH
jgi:prepilin-type N-terminal cleavage/methylation domain-containing protein/prepilin-type processing-associated H-X9-DG protein